MMVGHHGMQIPRARMCALTVLAAFGLMAATAAAGAPGRDARAGRHGIASRGHGAVRATALRADTFTDPIGLGDATPGLSWQLAGPASEVTQQTAYEVRAASSASRLGHPDLWDTGKVSSSLTNNITYAGKPLQSREDVVWQVRVWGANGRASAWSKPASWEMGLLSQSDWSAKWIDDPSYTYATNGIPNPLPIFAKSFFTQNGAVEKARLYVTGLGQYVASLNGKPVTSAVLEPGQTSYWNEVDYRTYDVTRLLHPGANVLGMETGSGAYQQADSTQVGRYMFQPGNNTVLGAPKVIAQLEITFANGHTETIATNQSWLTKLGPTTFSSWWGGEDYDARRIPPDWTDAARNLTGPGWQQAGLAQLTSSTIPRDTTPLVANPRPPVMVQAHVKPVSITQVAGPGATSSSPSYTGGTPVANWIWNTADSDVTAAAGTIYLRKTFTTPAGLTQALLKADVDDADTIYINGTQVASGTNWEIPQTADITSDLNPAGQENVIAVQATNDSVGAGGLIALVDLQGSNPERVVTDSSWKAFPASTASPPTASAPPASDWNTVGFDDSGWESAFVAGPYGIGPWGTTPEVSFSDVTNLVGPAQAGATSVKLASVTSLYPGDTLNIGSGDATQSVEVKSVGTAAGPATTLAAPASAGDTNIKVSSVGSACLAGSSCAGGTTSFVVGQPLLIDSGASQEVVRVTSVGTSGADGTGVTFTPALSADHAAGISVRDTGTGVTFTPALTSAFSDGEQAISIPGPVYVLDFGVNVAGLVQVKGSAPAGTTVSMIPAEAVGSDGNIDVSSTSASATDQIRYDYTFAGHGTETWHAQFTYDGMQYLEVHGLPSRPTPDEITILQTHAANRSTASFNSSSPLVNSIFGITKRALDNNMQSVLTDTPDREKGPYTGDNVQDVQTDLTLYDMQQFEGQLVRNITTSQRPNPFSSGPAGLIANIEPEYHIVPPAGLGGTDFVDEPNWAKAVIDIPWELYQVYGTTEPMRENYATMTKWLDYEAANKAANDGNIPGLGDWEAAQGTDPQPIIDFGYYDAVNTMAKIAQVLGKTDDAAKYSTLAASLKTEYNDDYLHTDSSGDAWYANNTEASNAVALDAGLVPDQDHQAVVNSLVAAVGAFNDAIGTGSVALGPMFRALHAAGRDDLIYKMITNPAGPSYAFLVDQGATTLWENLNGSGGSRDHQFLGDVAGWLVHDVVGIDAAPGSLEYRQLLIRPAVVGDLTHVSGSYTTPQGRASDSWAKSSDGTVGMTVTVPSNTTAEVWVPTSGRTVNAQAGASFSRDDSFDGIQYAVYDVGPGTFQFNGGGPVG